MHASRVPSLIAAAVASLIVGGVAAAQPAPPPPPPPPGGGYYVTPPPGPRHSGFTGGLDIGLGLTSVSPENGGGESYGGLSGLNFQLGGFVNPRLAISVRASGTSFTPDQIDGSDTTLISALLGVTAQYWVQPKLFVGGGLGVGILTSNQQDDEGETGLALTGRVGYELVQWTESALHLALEISPGFYDGGRVTSVGLQVGWQHY